MTLYKPLSSLVSAPFPLGLTDWVAKLDGNLSAYLRIHLKNGQPVDETSYSLSLLGPDKGCGIYRDTDHAIVLQKRTGNCVNAAALIGFEAEGDSLTIMQLQGAEGMEDALSPLVWDTMLYRQLADAGHDCGFRRARVLRAENNRHWENPIFRKGRVTPSRLRAHQKRLRRRYNEAPEEAGFRLDEEDKSYRVLEL